MNAVDNQGRTPLQRALIEGRCGGSFIALLLDRGAEVDLISAVLAGDEGRVRQVLEEEPGQIQARRWDGWSALDLAVDHEHAGIEVAAARRRRLPRSEPEGPAARGGAGARHPPRARPDAGPARRAGIRARGAGARPSTSARQITVAAWVYRIDRGGTVLGKWRQVDETWSYVLHMPAGGGGFRLRWEDGQTNVTAFSLPYLEWAHYAGTYDGERMRVYVNGELAAEAEVPGKRISSTGNPVWIGSSGYEEHTPALLDDVQIWNVARTPGADPGVDARRAARGRAGAGGLVADGRAGPAGRPVAPRQPRAPGRLGGRARPQAFPPTTRHGPEQVLWLLPLAE